MSKSLRVLKLDFQLIFHPLLVTMFSQTTSFSLKFSAVSEQNLAADDREFQENDAVADAVADAKISRVKISASEKLSGNPPQYKYGTHNQNQHRNNVESTLQVVCPLWETKTHSETSSI